jgi:glycerate kinase
MERAAAAAGWTCDAAPVSDGGEGLLDCFGGANRHTEVTGPLGDRVLAAWRLDGERAIVEMAAASGSSLIAGPADPMGASTRGTGELIASAIEAGARQVVVGAGGSATTDGGLGAVDVLRRFGNVDGSHGCRVVVAADVSTAFLDAARVFAPQKGADAEQVELLTRRLAALATAYRLEFGVDVTTLPGSGAAGGLAGGLAALGAAIAPGFDVVAAELDLGTRIGAADLVITGEGRFDATSLLGKAPVAVARLCRSRSVPVAMIVGALEAGVQPPAETVVLTAEFGTDAAMARTARCVETATSMLLARYQRGTR